MRPTHDRRPFWIPPAYAVADHRAVRNAYFSPVAPLRAFDGRNAQQNSRIRPGHYPQTSAVGNISYLFALATLPGRATPDPLGQHARESLSTSRRQYGVCPDARCR